jgi:site-specific DNA-methyltransferase (adenine-specific)
MAATLDIWSIPPESARRVGHPAPFPVELPEQLIRLYTFENDLVLDPFMGSGSALVAAARLGRRYVGYDLDANYVDISRRRVAEALDTRPEDPRGRALMEGKAAHKLAEQVLEAAGFTIAERKKRIGGTGVTVDFVATDADGAVWWFEVCGAFTSHRGGMLGTDTVWRSLGRACALQRARGGVPLVLLTSHLPRRPSEGDTALRAAGTNAFFDAVEMLSSDGLDRLERYAKGGFTAEPQPGFWRAWDLAR